MGRDIAGRAELVPLLAEIFRELGYGGTTLSEITARTGMGKGSLYHFFPAGKQAMAEAVLDAVAAWFENNVFQPLRERKNGETGIETMFAAVDQYFRSGRRVCLVGAFALDATRDHFAQRINAYFAEWVRVLAVALRRRGHAARRAQEIAEDIVAGIQGALVLSRAQNSTAVFSRTLKRLRQRAYSTVAKSTKSNPDE